MTPDDPIDAIMSILETEHARQRTKMSPSSRILFDLGVDGDDAAALLESINKRFGTDFTHIYQHWTGYFGNEGLPVGFLLIGLALSLTVTAMVVAINPWLHLPDWLLPWLSIALVLSLYFGIGSLLARRQTYPVTIADLADAVRSGSWPAEKRIADRGARLERNDRRLHTRRPVGGRSQK
jgi:hypothetical protein